MWADKCKCTFQIQCRFWASAHLICTGRVGFDMHWPNQLACAGHQGPMLYHRRGISGAWWVWPRICLTADWQPWPQASDWFLQHALPHSGCHGAAGATNHLFVKSECEGSKTQSGTFYLYGRVNVSVYGPYNQIFITKYSDYSERQQVNATLIDMM